jgi:serine/threonine protein phosphatase 1
MIKHFSANSVGRDFVVGDLHGCYDDFMTVLGMCAFDPSADRVFSVGDLIDRGPDSARCMMLLEEPWFHAVAGNHEAMMLDCIDDSSSLWHWVRNGGGWWAGEDTQTKRRLFDLAIDMPLAMTVGEGSGRFNVLHAEFFGSDADIDSENLSDEQRESILWGRSIAEHGCKASKIPESITYVGHTIVPDVVSVHTMRFIDTGSFLSCISDKEYVGRVTLIEPATGKKWQSNQSSVLPANMNYSFSSWGEE